MITNDAEVAELADALRSGRSGLRPVEVRVLSSAPNGGQQHLSCFQRTLEFDTLFITGFLNASMETH